MNNFNLLHSYPSLTGCRRCFIISVDYASTGDYESGWPWPASDDANSAPFGWGIRLGWNLLRRVSIFEIHLIPIRVKQATVCISLIIPCWHRLQKHLQQHNQQQLQKRASSRHSNHHLNGSAPTCDSPDPHPHSPHPHVNGYVPNGILIGNHLLGVRSGPITETTGIDSETNYFEEADNHSQYLDELQDDMPGIANNGIPGNMSHLNQTRPLTLGADSLRGSLDETKTVHYPNIPRQTSVSLRMTGRNKTHASENTNGGLTPVYTIDNDQLLWQTTGFEDGKNISHDYDMKVHLQNQAYNI